MKKFIVFTLLTPLFIFTQNSFAEDNAGRIKITVADKVVTETLDNSPSAKELAAMLPLSLSMSDLFGREKYAGLPKSLSEKISKKSRYDVGDIAYWAPGKSFVIFYRHDGTASDSGISIIGKIDSGVEIFDNGRKPVNVKVELIK